MEGGREGGGARGVSEHERERIPINLSLALSTLTYGEAARRSLVTPVSASFLLWSTHRNRKRRRELSSFRRSSISVRGAAPSVTLLHLSSSSALLLYREEKHSCSRMETL